MCAAPSMLASASKCHLGERRGGESGSYSNILLAGPKARSVEIDEAQSA